MLSQNDLLQFVVQYIWWDWFPHTLRLWISLIYRNSIMLLLFI